MTHCNDCRKHLPDLLFDEAYASAHPEISQHLAACTECRTELTELRRTFDLLDEFAAPEPSPYFDTRLHARLREEVAAQPEGFWERTRSFFLFSTGRHFRAATTAVLAITLLAGGGAVGFKSLQHPATSATVNDLRILDNNAQALQQMDQLLDDQNQDDETPAS